MKGIADSIVRKFHTTAPELLAEALRGAELHPCQLSHRPAPSDLTRVLLPGACVDMANLGADMLFTGAMPRDCYSLIYILECPRPGLVFNFGIEHQEGYLGFFAPGGALDATTPAGYRNISLTLPADDLHSAVAAHGLELPDTLLAKGNGLRVDPSHHRTMHAIASALRNLCDDPAQPLASNATRREVGRRVRDAFLGTLSSNTAPAQKLRIARRYEKLRQARDYLAEHVHEPVYLGDLCRATGLGRRAMQNLFHDLLGVTPIAHLQHIRLHGVRYALRRAEREPGAVKRLALEWGFWHLGQFAADYHALFSEYPSETLSGR